jgi:hypothetical protein
MDRCNRLGRVDHPPAAERDQAIRADRLDKRGGDLIHPARWHEVDLPGGVTQLGRVGERAFGREELERLPSAALERPDRIDHRPAVEQQPAAVVRELDPTPCGGRPQLADPLAALGHAAILSAPRARSGTRTHSLAITNRVLHQLSYPGSS